MNRWRAPHGEAGATALEYALLIGGIAAIVVVAVFAIGAITRGQVGSVCDSWRTAANDTSICR